MSLKILRNDGEHIAMSSSTAEVIVEEMLDILMGRKSFRRELKSMDRRTKSEFVQNLEQIVDQHLSNGVSAGREGTG